MYCPRCAAQHSEEAKYCRACGENLSLVAQAMAKHLPIVLANKLDAYLARKNERIRRDSVFNALVGTGCFGYFLYSLFVTGVTGTALFMLILALVCFVWAFWDFLVYKRSFSSGSGITVKPVEGDPRVSESRQATIPAPGVTENTTRSLDASNEQI